MMDTLSYYQEVEYLKKACIAYYKGIPIMSDPEYDHRYKSILQYEKDHPGEISKDSPTQKIYAPKGKVKHLKQMMSLESVDTFDELQDWVRKRKLPKDTEYWVDLKLDGMALEVVYHYGKLLSMSTRGRDGIHGEDVLHNYKMFIDVPHELPEEYHKTPFIVVYGEAILSKPAFSKLKQLYPKYSNARNAVAGILRMKEINEYLFNLVSFIVYDCNILNNSHLDISHTYLFNINYQNDKMKWLYELGFNVNKGLYPHPTLHTGLDSISVMYGVAQFNRKSSSIYGSLDFDIDGIVIKINDRNLQDKFEMGAKSPRWAIAWKFPAVVIKTCLSDVLWDVGMSSNIAPTGVLDPPCDFDGIVVTKVNLHNYKNIIDKKLKINSEVSIARLKDVIPGIVDVESIYENESDIIIPKQCPACGTPTTTDGIHLQCANPDCIGKRIKRIVHDLCKLGIKGLSVKSIEKLYPYLKTKDLEGVTLLSENTLVEVLGIKGKTIYNQLVDIH